MAELGELSENQKNCLSSKIKNASEHRHAYNSHIGTCHNAQMHFLFSSACSICMVLTVIVEQKMSRCVAKIVGSRFGRAGALLVK